MRKQILLLAAAFGFGIVVGLNMAPKVTTEELVQDATGRWMTKDERIKELRENYWWAIGLREKEADK